MLDIKIGTKLVLEPDGNATRTFGNNPITGTITNIGNKYFYVSVYGDENAPDNWPLKFDKTTFQYRGENNARYYIYETMEEYTKRKDTIKMASKLRRYFMDFTTKYDYDTIKKIYDILIQRGAIQEENPAA